jgi:hypothetical protein
MPGFNLAQHRYFFMTARFNPAAARGKGTSGVNDA